MPGAGFCAVAFGGTWSRALIVLPFAPLKRTSRIWMPPDVCVKCAIRPPTMMIRTPTTARVHLPSMSSPSFDFVERRPGRSRPPNWLSPSLLLRRRGRPRLDQRVVVDGLALRLFVCELPLRRDVAGGLG